MDNIEQEIKAALEARNIKLEPTPESAEDKPEELEVVPTTQTEPLPDLDQAKIEAEARELGWDPSKGNKTAEEWIKATPYIEAAKAGKNKIRQLEKTIEEMKKYMDTQRQIGYNQAMAEKQRAKEDAIIAGDIAGVKAIETEIEQLQAHKPVEPEPNQDLLNHPALQQFQKQNESWILDPSLEAQEIREFAAQRDKELAAHKLSVEEHCKLLDRDIHFKFKNYFGGKTSEPPMVATKDDISSRKHLDMSMLNKEQRAVAELFEKQKIMTKEQYIKSLKDSGVI